MHARVRSWTGPSGGSAGAAIGVVVAAATAGAIAPARALAQVPGEVRGRVVDARTERPVPGARVEAVDADVATTTADDGGFLLRGLEPRAYTLRVRAFGYAPRDAAVTVANGRTAARRVARPAAPRLDSVLVRSTRGASAQPGATSFDRHAIEASGRRDVGELLQTTPGVVVTQAGGPGAPTQISIRGSSAGQVLVLVDGVPVNSTITGDADLSRLALETIERVTVVPGSQSSRYGDRALGGVVLIETRRAVRDLSATVRSGAWGERDVGLTIGGTRDAGTQRLGGSFTADRRTVHGDFPYAVPPERGGGTARRENADARFGDLLVTASLDGARGGVQVRASWGESARGLVGSIVQPSLTGREHGDRTTGALDARWTAGPLAWTGTASLARERAAFADPSPPFGTPYDDAVDARAAVASGTMVATAGPGAAELGVEAREFAVRSSMLAAGAPRRQTQLGGWATLRAGRSLGRGVALTGDVGARLDRSSLLSGTVASPRAALGLTAGHVSVGGSVSSSFASPTLADEFFHEGVLVRPNPDLRPERVRGELEARVAVREVRAGPALVGGELSAYRAHVDGMILWMPNFQFVWSPTNYDVRRAGREASAHVAVPALGVDVQGALARADVTYAGPVLGGQVAYRPRTTGSVVVGAAVPDAVRAGARIEVTTRYVGERRTVPGYAVNPLAPYWRTDARLAAPVARRGWALDAALGIENVFDRPAAMLVDYPFPGRTWTVALRLRRGSATAARP